MIELGDRKSFFDFITANNRGDALGLKLKYSGKNLSFNLDFALTQITCRQKTCKKLKSFVSHREFLFPSTLSAEQASDERVGGYHASLCRGCHSVLDMTAGLGIDTMSLCRVSENVTAIELDKEKTECLQLNADTLGISNLNVLNCDSIEFIKNTDSIFDVIFIDPARRAGDGSRIYSLSQSQPDVTENLDNILSKTDNLIVKASPLLDVSQTFRELPGCHRIEIVCVDGECKEILAFVKKGGTPQQVSVVNLNEDETCSRIDFRLDELSGSCLILDDLSDKENGYIYEPNAGLMKLNCSHALCMRFDNLMKLSPSTNLYFSRVFHSEFPGRIFKIKTLPDKRDLKNLRNSKCAALSRNYISRADQMMKKYGLRESESVFLIGAGVGAKATPVLFLAEKFSELKAH